MNNRLSLSDLIALVAEKQNVTKKDAELFLRDFIALISEQVEGGDPVKIKDLGTFKLVKVNSRRSVDVNTGKETEIPAHYKMTFVPDKLLKEAVNRPFAHFENELLENEVQFENINTDTEDSIRNEISDEDVVLELPIEERSEDITIAPNIIESTDKLVEDSTATIESVDAESDSTMNVDDEKERIIKAMQEVERKPILKVMQEQGVDDKKQKRSKGKKRSSANKESLFQNKNIIGLVLLLVLVIGLLSYKLYENVFQNKKTAVPEVFNSQDVVIYDESDSLQVGKKNLSEDTSVIEKKDPLLTDTGKGDKGSVVIPKEEEIDVKSPGNKEPIPVVEKVVTPPQQQKKTLKSSQTEPITITTSAITDLRSLSLDYYGDKSYWVYIYEENIDVVDDAGNISAGIQLVIPARNKYGIDVNNKASLQKAKDIESEMTGY